MDCEYKITETIDGLNVLKCVQCGHQAISKYGPELVHTRCRKSPSRGLGDTVAKTMRMLGIKGCRGCKKRQHWLNKMVPYRRR